jgi:protein involved in sex pheromone biosynthesis
MKKTKSLSICEVVMFLAICFLCWFVNHQNDKVIFLKESLCEQDKAILTQAILIEYQKKYISKNFQNSKFSPHEFWKIYD